MFDAAKANLSDAAARAQRVIARRIFGRVNARVRAVKAKQNAVRYETVFAAFHAGANVIDVVIDHAVSLSFAERALRRFEEGKCAPRPRPLRQARHECGCACANCVDFTLGFVLWGFSRDPQFEDPPNLSTREGLKALADGFVLEEVERMASHWDFDSTSEVDLAHARYVRELDPATFESLDTCLGRMHEWVTAFRREHAPFRKRPNEDSRRAYERSERISPRAAPPLLARLRDAHRYFRSLERPPRYCTRRAGPRRTGRAPRRQRRRSSAKKATSPPGPDPSPDRPRAGVGLR